MTKPKPPPPVKSWQSLANTKNTIDKLHELINSKEWKWYDKPEYKYVNLRIDMRDGGFCLIVEDKRIELDDIINYRKVK